MKTSDRITLRVISHPSTVPLNEAAWAESLSRTKSALKDHDHEKEGNLFHPIC
jgi:hypothetical protein